MSGYTKTDDYCTFSPDRLFGVTFNYGCYLHDRQYRHEVKKRKTRKQADQDLRDYIKSRFNQSNKPIRGWLVSNIYYCAVRIFSWRLWV